MKKILSIVLAAAMVVVLGTSMTACSSNNGGGSSASGQVVVGDITELDPTMLYGWTNGSSNAKVRTLIFEGYSPVVYTKEGNFEWNNTVVKKHEGTNNPDGSKTYTVTINDGLTWNDGVDADGNKKDPTPITAQDFVFSILLMASPQFQSLGGADWSSSSDFLGYDDFYKGNSNKLAGVHLVDPMTFSITIDASKLPFYFDSTYASVTPFPMFVIAPGCTIKDDGDGAYIDGPFTNDLLVKTINDPDTGYRYAPKVSAGMYQFDSFNAADKEVVLTANPYYKGTFDGATAKIARIVVRYVSSATQFDELSAGNVDMLSPAGDGEAINTGLKLMEDNEGKFSDVTYSRAGYGMLVFSCDVGPTQFTSVRQAVAYCLDRDTFCKQYTGGYGVVVNGPYSLSQWEYTDNKQLLDEKLNSYSFNTDKAKEVLIADGWTLDKDGNPYDESKGGGDTGNVRYKKLDDGTLMPLIIEWASTSDNPVADLVNTMLPPEAAKVGMQIKQTVMDFPAMLDQLYRTGSYTPPPKYNMFNLAAGFVPVPSYWYQYSMDPQYDGSFNQDFLHDQKLADLAMAMKTTQPGDKDTWEKNWLAFMERWNELIPEIPLYSNEYHVFYNSKIKNVDMNPLWEWEMALQYASVG